MGEFDGLLQGAVRQAQAANQPENGDYYDDEGFLVCGNCHTRRQVEVNMPDLKAVPFDPKKKVRVKMPVSCRCRAERRKQEEQMLMQDREMRAAQTLQRQSLMDERLRDISFDGFQQTKDNAYNLKLCLRYAKHFDEMMAKNQGLLFYGGVGTGKTFAAACIANHLLSLRVPVVMTSFVKLLETMQGFSEDDGALIARLNREKLLIIDDLGTELNNSFINSQLFLCINERILNKKSTIISTNLSLEQINRSYTERVFSRIIQSYTLLHIYGEDIRIKKTFSSLDE